jgi:hypothetical protein
MRTEAQAWKLMSGLWLYSEKIATRTQVTLGLGQTDLATEVIEVKLYPKAKPKIYAVGEDVGSAQSWATQIDRAVRVLTAHEKGFWHLCRAAGDHALGEQLLAARALLALRAVDGECNKTTRRYPRLRILP